MDPVARIDRDNDSWKNRFIISNSNPMARRTINIPCQPANDATTPPMTGATTGATPFTAPIMAIILANCRPRYRSAATERDSTMPPEAPIPWAFFS